MKKAGSEQSYLVQLSLLEVQLQALYWWPAGIVNMGVGGGYEKFGSQEDNKYIIGDTACEQGQNFMFFCFLIFFERDLRHLSELAVETSRTKEVLGHTKNSKSLVLQQSTKMSLEIPQEQKVDTCCLQQRTSHINIITNWQPVIALFFAKYV